MNKKYIQECLKNRNNNIPFVKSSLIEYELLDEDTDVDINILAVQFLF